MTRVSQSQMTTPKPGQQLQVRGSHSGQVTRNQMATAAQERVQAMEASVRNQTGCPPRAPLEPAPRASGPRAREAAAVSELEPVTASRSRTVSRPKVWAREWVQEAPRAVNRALWRLRRQARRLQGASHRGVMARRARRRPRTGQLQGHQRPPQTAWAFAARGKASRRNSSAGMTVMEQAREGLGPLRQVAPYRASPETCVGISYSEL